MPTILTKYVQAFSYSTSLRVLSAYLKVTLKDWCFHFSLSLLWFFLAASPNFPQILIAIFKFLFKISRICFTNS